MSDPFDVLREDGAGAAPDVAAIKARARGIVRRRQIVLGAGAAAIALVAFIGVVVRPGTDQTALLSEGTRSQDAARTVEPTTVTAGEELSAVEGAARAPEPQRIKSGSKSAGGGVSAGTVADTTVASDALVLTLAVKEGSVAERGAEFTLKVCNTGSASVRRDFSSGQRYDFVVKRGDETVWRWSDGRAFAQIVGTETWEPDDCKTYTDSWGGMKSDGTPAPSGKYAAIGVLASSERERSKAVEFCLDLC